MLAVRIAWLMLLSLVFVGVLTLVVGPWFALAAFVALVVYGVISEAERRQRIARVADEARRAQLRACQAQQEADAAVVEAEVAQIQIRLLRANPDLFR